VSNLPPYFGSSSNDVLVDQTLNAGATFTYSPTITDPESASVSLTIGSAPSFVTIANGKSIKIAPSFTVSDGTYPVKDVTLSDGANTIKQSFNVIVKNAPPYFGSSTADTLADQTVTAGATIIYAPITTDPEGGPVTVTATTLPPFITIVSNAFNIAPKFSVKAGIYLVDAIKISDGVQSSSIIYSFNVVVNNLPPYFGSSPSDTLQD
jgi:hypothetical protein